jgi:hypothetical protein
MMQTIKYLTGKNFIGADELAVIASVFPVGIPSDTPVIPFSSEIIKQYAKDYIFILGVSEMTNGQPMTLLSLREHFGVNPDVSEPCFYNQDWYLKEKFMTATLENKWYLVKKDIIEESRAVQPSELIKNYNFPSAILCAYTFFVWYFLRNEYLWAHDFIWCSDTDHNGDRIYVGKYHDVDGINKNGFSIHRHLELRMCYGAVDEQSID